MARLSTSTPLWRLSIASLLLTILIPANALYFYIDGESPRCFHEELPKDTMVVGDFQADSYDTSTQSYNPTDKVGMLITVDETFDNDHRVVSQRAPSKGRFTFTAQDSGDHRICFRAWNVPASGWLSGGVPAQGGVKFTLDLVIGETSKIESDDRGKVEDLVGKVKDLNRRLEDIRREQVFQREREAEFRNQSETVNARVVRWTIIQLVVLGVTCAWQLSHLRSFFIKQKLT